MRCMLNLTMFLTCSIRSGDLRMGHRHAINGADFAMAYLRLQKFAAFLLHGLNDRRF